MVKRPGDPVRGSKTGRPIMVLLDLLGRRWVLRIVWELRDRPRRFRELQETIGGASPTIVNARLGDLRAAGLVELDSNGYRLTALGRELLALFLPLHVWSERWAKSLTPSSKSRRREATLRNG